MRSSDIIDLLAIKHSEDVFVPECKDGPTHYTGHLRMDAWVMKKSWAKPLVTVYEIKVSRSDFMGDEKWRYYLPFCNEFYFVCPTGLILPNECPPEAGLLYVSKTGGKLFKKKKPSYREVEIPDSLFRYVLFSRAQIQREYLPESKVKYWERWLKEKEHKQEIGHMVSHRLGEIVRTANRRANRAEERVKECAEIEKRIAELGFNPQNPIYSWDIKNALEELGGIPRELRGDLIRMRDNAAKLLDDIETYEKRKSA
jgi:hypothetical protein